MSRHRFSDATTAQLERLIRPLLAARIFPSEDVLRAVYCSRPGAIQVNERGDVAVLDRWRDHLDLIAIEALWCPHHDLPAAIADLRVCADRHGFSGLVSPPVLEVDVPLYRSAGLSVREILETLEIRAGELRHTEPSATCTVRPALPADISAVLGIDAACFEPFWRYDRRHLERFQGTGSLVLAERDGRCLGYTLVTVDRGSAVLGRLCVDTPFQRQGIGRHLVRSALETAFDAGAQHVSLSARRDNVPALELYRAVGFRVTGRRYAFLTLGSDVRGGDDDRIDPIMGD